MMETRDRTAIVTGAGGGIGRAIALEAAARGMSVCIADIDEQKLAETEKVLRERQVSVVAQRIDVRQADDVERFAEECFKAYQSIAMVWANAGVIRYGPGLDVNLADWNFVIDVNLRGVINGVAAFVRRLHDRDEEARFVITASQATFMTVPGLAPYAASKHACWAIADTLRQELLEASSKVTAMMLAPPRVDTDIISSTLDKVRADGGEAAVEAFRETVMTPETLAREAFESAIDGGFLILPGYEDIRPIVAKRYASLV